jgi:hypothetical protein
MMSVVKQVIDTDQDGARLSAEQLADAGVKPGERAVIEIRASTGRCSISVSSSGRVMRTSCGSSSAPTTSTSASTDCLTESAAAG